MKRSTAVITDIGTILIGSYVSGGEEPNHVVSGGRKLFRINIMASVIAVDGMNVTVDDGSGGMQLRSFDEEFSGIAVGDILLVIGKPREYGGTKYIVPEVIKKITNPNWLKLRKLQLERASAAAASLPQPPQLPEAEYVVEESVDIRGYEAVTAAVRSLDTGSGADTEDVIRESRKENAESIIIALLREGELFEIKPGKLKVLE